MFFADCAFKSTKKLNRDILGWLDKPKVPGNCRFLLSNPHSAESVYFVPQSNLRYQAKIIIYL